MTTPSTLTRVTKIALIVNAVAHGAASVGMATGLEPRAAGEPFMGRRAAAAGLAGVFMMVFVSRRLARDAALITLPIAFVVCNFAVTVYDFLMSGDPRELIPAIFEGTFLAIYSAYAASQLRSSKQPSG